MIAREEVAGPLTGCTERELLITQIRRNCKHADGSSVQRQRQGWARQQSAAQQATDTGAEERKVKIGMSRIAGTAMPRRQPHPELCT